MLVALIFILEKENETKMKNRDFILARYLIF